MTPKQRLLLALEGQKPDHLPATVYQWHVCHLENHMHLAEATAAFEQLGLDASIHFDGQREFDGPLRAARSFPQTSHWRHEITVVDPDPENYIQQHQIVTPDGKLSYQTTSNHTTTWISEYLIKRHEDVELIERYMPIAKLDRSAVAEAYDRLGDRGILRGSLWGAQPGCWQHAACLIELQDLLAEAITNPDWVHYLLDVLLQKKLSYIDQSLQGAKFDLVETGGHGSSDAMVASHLHREFCLPYDRQLHDALHAVGLKTSYHTSGGMLSLLDLIIENGTDAAETLAPPQCGGNIAEPAVVRDKFGGRVAMIGGLDQFEILTSGTPEKIRAEVQRLFEGFGSQGGYICSNCDHFFDAPVENLRAFAEAARECAY